MATPEPVLRERRRERERDWLLRVDDLPARVSRVSRGSLVPLSKVMPVGREMAGSRSGGSEGAMVSGQRIGGKREAKVPASHKNGTDEAGKCRGSGE